MILFAISNTAIFCNTGAQSDSEVSTTSTEANSNTRGYASDSEIDARHAKGTPATSPVSPTTTSIATSPDEVEVKASSHGSWLLVYLSLRCREWGVLTVNSQI